LPVKEGVGNMKMPSMQTIVWGVLFGVVGAIVYEKWIAGKV
jgi:hypothetical protein